MTKVVAKAREVLDSSAIGVAAITCFEITRLVEHRRINLERDVLTWFDSVFALPTIIESGLVQTIW